MENKDKHPELLEYYSNQKWLYKSDRNDKWYPCTPYDAAYFFIKGFLVKLF